MSIRVTAMKTSATVISDPTSHFLSLRALSIVFKWVLRSFMAVFHVSCMISHSPKIPWETTVAQGAMVELANEIHWSTWDLSTALLPSILPPAREAR